MTFINDSLVDLLMLIDSTRTISYLLSSVTVCSSCTVSKMFKHIYGARVSFSSHSVSLYANYKFTIVTVDNCAMETIETRC